MLKYRLLLLHLTCAFMVFGQRTYLPASVLASGNWYKIAVKEAGIYKVDVALLNKLGVNTPAIASTAVRLYGNGGQMLPESCSANVTDDLQENAIEMVDGGDGLFNGADYFLFYAAGPDNWFKDSVNRRFMHQKNVYSDRSYFFITIGGTGQRIKTIAAGGAMPQQTITSFNDRYFHESDTINFLNSGKEWYGEEFSNTPGRTTSRTFTIPLTNPVAGEPATIVSNCISRSINAVSDFSVSINNAPVLQQFIPGVGTGNQDLFARESNLSAAFIPSGAPTVTYAYHPGGSGAQGWLNWFEIFFRRNLSLNASSQLTFRDWNSVWPVAGAFVLQGATASTRVWDVTRAGAPGNMEVLLTGSTLKFVNDCSTLHEYMAFNNTGFLAPAAIGKVENQDLHHEVLADLLIIAHPAVLEQARRLADYHLQQQLKSVVVTADQVYNEFASGAADPTALRNFIKMFYDRAGTDTARRPKYVLLFGDASFDYKNRLRNNTNQVPAYQSNASLDPLATYTSDDYFGFLDDYEDINATNVQNLLDVGIGRVPAGNEQDAKAYVDKIIRYNEPAGLGPWRNQLTFVADDEDANLHLHDAETVAATAAATNSLFIQKKLYLDAFREESNASGSRFPEANAAINGQIANGTLIWNYSGHGGFRRLAEEVVLDQDILNAWNNPDRLPLFITATCDFAPYDNPAVQSLGENILLKQKTGAIALMTTTRLVFAYSNRIINRNYLLTALQPKPNGSYLSLGEAVKLAKNTTYQSSTDITNNLKFTLLGDPALTLAYPRYKVQTTAINNKTVGSLPDTLKALRPYTISGSVTDERGNRLPQFNGTVYAAVYDKLQTRTTLANDPGSYQENFPVQENLLFKGRAEVVNGGFSFSFVTPIDINYQAGFGRISYYAENGRLDGNGSFTNVIIGGSQGISADVQGPEIKAYLNNGNFTNGATTGQTPVLLLTLKDTSGINITGTGIGHDITAMLDGDAKKLFVLNSFFETDLNTYRQGTVRFPLPELEAGEHTLTIRAWDGANNSNMVTIRFVVNKQPFSILRLFNFPNPFTTGTTFRFEHDLDVQNIQVSLSIFTSTGKLVKSLKHTINTGGSRSLDVEWDGKNNAGISVQHGMYIYFLNITTTGGANAQKAGKMIVL